MIGAGRDRWDCVLALGRGSLFAEVGSTMSGTGPEPIRVAHVTEASGGGVRQHLRRIVPRLRARGVTIDIILSPLRFEPDFREDLELYRKLGCRVELCPIARGISPWHDLRAARQIRSTLRSWNPHVVHTHATKAGLLGRIAAGPLTNVRTVYSPHAFPFEEFRVGMQQNLFVKLEQRMVRATSLFVLVSQFEKDVATNVFGIRERQIRVVENGVETELGDCLLSREEARAALGITSSGLAVAVPGRLVHQKGQNWLLESLMRVCREDCPLHLYFCGAGPDETQLRKASQRLGVATHVTWLGYISHFAAKLSAFDLVLLPSRYEGLSYMLLETLCAGIPMIVSDIKGHFPRDEIREHVVAVPLEDTKALGEALLAFAANPAAYALDPTWGRNFVKAHFSLDAQVDKLMACYRELAAETATQRGADRSRRG